MKLWLKYRWLRFLVLLKRNSVGFILKKIDGDLIPKLNPIQKIIFSITLKLIHDSNSELSSNSIDYTYMISNNNYLIIIRPEYSISFFEYRNEHQMNTFDVGYDPHHTKSLIKHFEKEVQRRMRQEDNQKTNRIVKHLESIVKEIEDKQKIR